MIRVLVIDDEKPSRDELMFLLSDVDDVEIAGEAEDGIEALSLITRLEPDLLFLDIQMPEMSGVELAESIQHMEHKPYIIFTTAYESFAIKAFEVGALDYLLKPYEKDRLVRSIERYKKNSGKPENDVSEKIGRLLDSFNREADSASTRLRIAVIKGDTYLPLKPEDIVAVIASGKKTRIITGSTEYEDHRTISYFEELLGEDIFFRCHRSYLINVNHIQKIGLWFNNTYQLTMENLTERVPVSRSKVHDFRKLMSIE